MKQGERNGVCAEVNGVVENYRITVQDNGEPNQGIDTFAFHSTATSPGPSSTATSNSHKQASTL